MVVASGFSYTGQLCCGNGGVGTPASVSLYVGGYTPAIGILSFAGSLDSNEIYFEVTQDHFASNGVPVMAGTCLKGTVTGNICNLTPQ